MLGGGTANFSRLTQQLALLYRVPIYRASLCSLPRETQSAGITHPGSAGANAPPCTAGGGIPGGSTVHGARGRLCQPGGIAPTLLLLPHLHLSWADAAQAAELLCSGHIIPVFTAVLGLASALLIPPGSRGQKFSKRKVSCRAKGVPARTRCPTTHKVSRRAPMPLRAPRAAAAGERLHLEMLGAASRAGSTQRLVVLPGGVISLLQRV